MNKNHLTQVVILFLLTIGILLGVSALKPTDISFTTKKVDLLSSLRNEPVAEEPTENEFQGEYEDTNEDAATSIGYKDKEKAIDATADSNELLAGDSTAMPPIKVCKPARPQINAPRKAGDITLIEDYTFEQSGLKNLEAVLCNDTDTIQRTARIAILGDSFTEADIMTQNIRLLLQDEYGGCGVGYMPMYSDCPGFRHSVSHVCEGWETHSVISKPEYKNTSLTLQLHRPQDSTKTITRFKGVNKLRHLDRWDVSKIGFITNETAVISVKTDSGRRTYNVLPDDKAQFITIAQTTQSLEIKCDRQSVAFWGAWLDGNKGITVDNISVRGYSGTTIQNIPSERLKQLNEAIPYDMIILQYGLNTMSKDVTDYTYFTKHLVNTVNHLHTAFPHTDILIMGISDRCQNIDGTIQTMKAVYALRQAQRNAAIEAGCHFWDCCEAMKTLGGMATFVDNRWANKDYTHINRAGGARVAEEFIKAMKYALEKRVATAAQTETKTESETQADTQTVTEINE
jgi:lysophospholipase L1-like esterase